MVSFQDVQQQTSGTTLKVLPKCTSTGCGDNHDNHCVASEVPRKCISGEIIQAYEVYRATPDRLVFLGERKEVENAFYFVQRLSVLDVNH